MTAPTAEKPGRRRFRDRVAVLGTAVVGVVVLGIGWVVGSREGPRRCGSGFATVGGRCCGEGQTLERDHCVGMPSRCGGSLRALETGCDALPAKIQIAGGTLHVSTSDWEADGRTVAREIVTTTFLIDAYEVSWSRYDQCAASGKCLPLALHGEPGQPVTRVTAFEAGRFCAFAGGSLPSSDQWLFAAAGADARRFPWGPNGAVCGRAAWGVADGPCFKSSSEPDVTGSHPEGRTPDGVEDLAGNVAEWTRLRPDGLSEARGGSWRSREATLLKTWASELVAGDVRRDDIGFRCVYPP